MRAPRRVSRDKSTVRYEANSITDKNMKFILLSSENLSDDEMRRVAHRVCLCVRGKNARRRKICDARAHERQADTETDTAGVFSFLFFSLVLFVRGSQRDNNTEK